MHEGRPHYLACRNWLAHTESKLRPITFHWSLSHAAYGNDQSLTNSVPPTTWPDAPKLMHKTSFCETKD